MRVPSNPPHLTLVTNTEELRQRIADKIPKRRRGRPRKPAALSAAEIDARRSEAFFQMEEPLRDACDHAEIAGTLLRDGRPDLCPLIVWELEEKLLALRANWLKESSKHAE
jgi:hypothetical protein